MTEPLRVTAADCVSYRSGGPRDRDQVISLAGSAFHSYGPYEGIVGEWLDSGEPHLIVGYRSGVLISFLLAQRSPYAIGSRPEAEVMAIAVEPAFQRQGVGRRLLTLAEAWAEHGGFHALTAQTAVQNEAARSFFAGQGFFEAGRIPEFYPAGQDAVFLIKIL